jgi:hypothetical protein
MTGNLKSHRDGYTQDGWSDKGCDGRLKAKAQEPDLEIPPSVAEVRKAEAAARKGTGPLSSFVVATPNVAFNNTTLNQMATLWLIRHAQPWSRMEDPILRGMMQYLRKDASLNGRRWAADEAKSINVSLKEQVFSELKVSFYNFHKEYDDHLIMQLLTQGIKSKFNLIHDGWTTKGNRHAFIGAAVTYVDETWTYRVRHLTMKVVAWHHHGPWLAEPMVNLLVKRGIFQKISTFFIYFSPYFQSMR